MLSSSEFNLIKSIEDWRTNQGPGNFLEISKMSPKIPPLGPCRAWRRAGHPDAGQRYGDSSVCVSIVLIFFKWQSARGAEDERKENIRRESQLEQRKWECDLENPVWLDLLCWFHSPNGKRLSNSPLACRPFQKGKKLTTTDGTAAGMGAKKRRLSRNDPQRPQIGDRINKAKILPSDLLTCY